MTMAFKDPARLVCDLLIELQDNADFDFLFNNDALLEASGF